MHSALSSSRKPFALASAPPGSEDDSDDHSEVCTGRSLATRRHQRIDGPRIARSLVAAVAAWPAPDATLLLRSLALVGRAYREAAQVELFRHLTIGNSEQLRRCVSVLAKNATLGRAVHDLTLHPRGGDAKSRDRVLKDARALLHCLPNLRKLDEELFKGDFDVTDLDKDHSGLRRRSGCTASAHEPHGGRLAPSMHC